MNARQVKFLKILHIELEELVSDVNTAMETLKNRESKKEITHYVKLENTVVLTEELLAVQRFLKDMDETSFESVQTLNDLCSFLKKLFEEEVKTYQYPDFVLGLVNGRLEKTRRYVEEGL